MRKITIVSITAKVLKEYNPDLSVTIEATSGGGGWRVYH